MRTACAKILLHHTLQCPDKGQPHKFVYLTVLDERPSRLSTICLLDDADMQNAEHGKGAGGTLLRSMTLWWTTGRMTECQREDQRSRGCGRLVATLLRTQPPMSAYKQTVHSLHSVL